jgi:cyclase
MVRSDRREFLVALLSGAAGLTITRPAFGQNAQGQGAAAGRGGRGGPAPVTATKLADRLVVLGGTGGNVGLVIGPEGLLMIDGGTANRAADLGKAIAEISPRMVQLLFNTHYHFDHVGSNEYLGNKTVRIIAHENVKKRLAMRFENPAMGRTMEPLSDAGQPTETFAAGGKLTFGPETLEYTHTPLAHTDGDAFFILRASNILHTGDLLWTGRYPVVDYTAGGSLKRMAETLEQMDKLIEDSTRIIPGHGPASVTRSDMRQTRDMWLAVNQRLEDHARQGHSVDEVVMAAPTKDFDEKVGVRMPDAFVRQAYGGVLATR